MTPEQEPREEGELSRADAAHLALREKDEEIQALQVRRSGRLRTLRRLFFGGFFGTIAMSTIAVLFERVGVTPLSVIAFIGLIITELAFFAALVYFPVHAVRSAREARQKRELIRERREVLDNSEVVGALSPAEDTRGDGALTLAGEDGALSLAGEHDGAHSEG